MLPPLLVDLIGYSKIIFLYLKWRRLLNRNKALHNVCDGKKVYILGNGPSLNNFDLASIKSEFVITMNHFALHPLRDQFNIIAHCIGDPYKSKAWDDPIPMISGVKARTYWMNADWIPYFLGKSEYNLFYYLPGVRSGATIMQGANISGIALQYESTSQMAINVALYMGFKEIFLVGLDHDWLVTRGNSPHFYQDADGAPKADLSKWSYTEMIQISLSLFKIYAKLKKTAAERKAKITNLSSPTYLDVFY